MHSACNGLHGTADNDSRAAARKTRQAPHALHPAPGAPAHQHRTPSANASTGHSPSSSTTAPPTTEPPPPNPSSCGPPQERGARSRPRRPPPERGADPLRGGDPAPHRHLHGGSRNARATGDAGGGSGGTAPPGFNNRRRAHDQLPPSLESVVSNQEHRISRLAARTGRGHRHPPGHQVRHAEGAEPGNPGQGVPAGTALPTRRRASSRSSATAGSGGVERRGLVDGAIVALLFHGALRRSEVAALCWADVVVNRPPLEVRPDRGAC